MRIRSRLMPEMQQLSQKAYDRLVAELQDLTTRGRIDIARKMTEGSPNEVVGNMQKQIDDLNQSN